MQKKIKSALISVYQKEGLEPIVKSLNNLGIRIYSTGGTHSFICDLGIEAVKIEDLTGYPSIFDGRVKSLHPKIFGGILSIRNSEEHAEESEKYDIPEIDLVIVDLYPFEETVKTVSETEKIIEKIDIGGISLIRAAAKNYNDVLVVSCMSQYSLLYSLLEEHNGYTDYETRKDFAKYAFGVSSAYDTAIFNWFDDNSYTQLRIALNNRRKLRYGENPHQKAWFFGNQDEMFEQLHGKELSYNNLLDVDAAINLICEFDDTSLAIIKHNNACGMASGNSLIEVWRDALEADPVSAFGGIIITNAIVDFETAQEINKIFFEIIIANDYTEDAFEILASKKNRIIIKQKSNKLPEFNLRTNLNGVLVQERDFKIETNKNLNCVTDVKPDESQISDLIFANKLVKNTKSNAIVLVKNKQLLASGTGQTSRVDALKQAIVKAKNFGFDLQGAVIASDAFFPFKDSVEIAHKEGINAVIQPGGSIRDNETIDFCNQNDIAMVLTGTRHFKH
jgi:phosphoribosylaminoimidazolecarboxamide formyltransferase / IMP cyclohydrolase